MFNVIKSCHQAGPTIAFPPNDRILLNDLLIKPLNWANSTRFLNYFYKTDQLLFDVNISNLIKFIDN
jgi:hypothetical protein